MNHDEILKQVNDVFIDVLDNPDIVIDDSTTAKDVEEWDSLNHIQLVVALERHFEVKFIANEIRSWKNVGEICASIEAKVKN